MTPNLAAEILSTKAQELRCSVESRIIPALARAVTDTLHSPEEFAQLFEAIAYRLRDEASELKGAYQNSNAGAIWDKIAHNLDALATRNRKLTGHW